MKPIHTFANGVKVFRHYLTQDPFERYRRHNLHEPEEEAIFLQRLALVPHQGTFVIIGAAIGNECLLAKKIRQGFKIVAYEPLSAHRRFFQENIRLNPMRAEGFR